LIHLRRPDFQEANEGEKNIRLMSQPKRGADKTAAPRFFYKS